MINQTQSSEIKSSILFVFFVCFPVRRQKDDMQVNVAGIRRNIKNLAHNYSDPQVSLLNFDFTHDSNSFFRIFAGESA